MKKLLAVVVLLLAVSILLCSCSSSQKTNTDTQGTEKETEEKKVQTVYGIWYSQNNQTVLDVRDLNNVSYYELKIGFYEYESKTTASCTYEDYILTMKTEDDKTLTWVFDAQKGVLSASNGSDSSSYAITDKLPTEYQSVPFADYSKIDCLSLVTLGAHTGLRMPASVEAQAAYDIFSSYYEAKKETPATLSNKTVAEVGDIVKIDYKGFLNGEAFSGGEAAGQTVFISANSNYIPGFAEGIAGKTVGSTFDVTVTFPKNYQSAELAGKDAVFTMTLHAIYNPVIADDKISEFSEKKYDTYQKMLDAQIEDLSKDGAWDDVVGGVLWNQVLSKTVCENVPEEAYAFFLQYFIEYYHYYAFYYGVDYETFMKQYVGYTEEDLVAQAKETAVQYIAAYAIAEKYNITVSDEIYSKVENNYIESIMESNGLSREDAKVYVQEKEINTVNSSAVEKAVMYWLIEQNTAKN